MGIKLWGLVLKPAKVVKPTRNALTLMIAKEAHRNELSWAREGLAGLTAPYGRLLLASSIRKSEKTVSIQASAYAIREYSELVLDYGICIPTEYSSIEAGTRYCNNHLAHGAKMRKSAYREM